MELTRTRRLLALIVALLCAPCFADDRPASKALTAEGQKHLDSLLADAVAKKHSAGVVALVTVDGKPAYRKAVGHADVEAKKPMEPDSLFRIASMTKPVASVAVMILVDDGKLKPEDPVSKYLPEFKETKVLVPGKEKGENTLVPAETPVTIHHLLTHTSGITYRLFSPPALHEYHKKAGVHDGVSPTDLTTAENMKRIASVPLAHQPGSAFTYGLNTDVLGGVVEAVSGQSLEAFLKERLFDPLKMKDTYFYPPEEKLPRLAALYQPTKDKSGLERTGEEPTTQGQLIYSPAFPYRGKKAYFSGGAGLVSTAPDYARFLQMLLNGGELDGVRVLKPETVKRILSNQAGKLRVGPGPHGDQFGYGFGLVSEGGQDAASPGSFSWGGLFATYFWADPQKKLAGVLMTQTYPSPRPGLAVEFKKLVYEALPK